MFSVGNTEVAWQNKVLDGSKFRSPSEMYVRRIILISVNFSSTLYGKHFTQAFWNNPPKFGLSCNLASSV
jgi:hypothetical protein